MTQLGSGARGSAADAERASRRAADARGVAERGGAVMDEVVTTMRGITDSARRIAEITGLIDGIAARTNMLALNAAVEAARAGEQGRGFAVVASEVRALAQRSAEAARSIAELIQASGERVHQGSDLVVRAGSTMHELVSTIGDVSTLVAAISQASAAQSKGVATIGASLAQLDQGTQQNAALVEQGAAASMALQQQAQGLLQAVAAFRLAEPAAPAAAPSHSSHSSAPMAAAFARQDLP
jgi:methyl-accepting chemotaxis protein